MRTYGPTDGPRGPRPTEEQARVRRMLQEVADRARSPYLDLDRFTADAPDQWLDDVDVADKDDRDAAEDAWAVPAKDKYEAWMRRGALILAANTIVDECFDDLAAFPEPDSKPDEETIEGTFAGRWLPPRFRPYSAEKGRPRRSVAAHLVHQHKRSKQALDSQRGDWATVWWRHARHRL